MSFWRGLQILIRYSSDIGSDYEVCERTRYVVIGKTRACDKKYIKINHDSKRT